MTKDEFHKIIGAYRRKYQRDINNLYIWCSVAIDSLDRALSDDNFLHSQKFSVPSSRAGKTVKREKSNVISIIENAKNQELYFSVFAYLVAQAEAFFQDILYQSLLFDENKIKVRVNGIDPLKKIDVAQIIDRKSRKALIKSIIEQELISLFYARPIAQFDYLEKVTSVVLDDQLKDKWIENKATRDLIVHNSGVINKLYIKKSGDSARGKEGDTIVVDKQYLEASMANMKSLIGKICSQIQKGLK